MMSNINIIVDYYHKCFKESNTAKTYAKLRGLSKASILQFKIGYCPPKPLYSNRFHDRLIFPIWDAHDNVIGWTGRTLIEATAKYVNVKESVHFKKSRLLYGYNFAKPEIFKTGEAILVEGQMDVIFLNQYGIKNVVATSGTNSFKLIAASLIARYAKKVYIIFDADSAGKLAVEGAKMYLNEMGITDVVNIVLPDGYDPASYILEFGKDSFLGLLYER